MPNSNELHVFRRLRRDGGTTLTIQVRTNAPNGRLANPVRISCDYGSAPQLLGALQAAVVFCTNELHLHGGHDE